MLESVEYAMFGSLAWCFLTLIVLFFVVLHSLEAHIFPASWGTASRIFPYILYCLVCYTSFLTSNPPTLIAKDIVLPSMCAWLCPFLTNNHSPLSFFRVFLPHHPSLISHWKPNQKTPELHHLHTHSANGSETCDPQANAHVRMACNERKGRTDYESTLLSYAATLSPQLINGTLQCHTISNRRS